jgi:hypothetical protein
MDEHDLALRNRIYREVVDRGRPPARAEIADDEALRRLHDAHAIVLDSTGEIAMANPFSAAPTPYRVEVGGRSWYGNCAWDAFGIPAALHEDGHVSTECADCGEAIEIDLRGGPQPADYVFHLVVPASRWWDDIAFT